MNRRHFLRALVAAPVAALAAPAVLAKTAFASGALMQGSAPKWGYIGEIGPEITGLPAGEDMIRDLARKGVADALRVWPDFGVPFDMAQKGYDQALADGDINESGELIEA